MPKEFGKEVMRTSLVGALFFAAPAWAVPMQVAHQGRLYDGESKPLEGSHTLHLTLFEGDKAVWKDSVKVEFRDGWYEVVLGAGTPLSSDLFLGKGLQIARRVDDQAERTDRVPVVSVPYAVRAATAESVPWNSITGVPADITAPPKPEPVKPLTEAEIEAFITNGSLDLAKGTTLGGVAIATGPHTPPLSEKDVEAYVTNAPLDLAKGSTIGGQAVSVGPHTPPVTEKEVEGYVTNAPIDLAKGSTIGGQVLSVGPHTPPVTEGEVEGYVTNAPIDLAKGSTIGGQALSVGPHTPPVTEKEVEGYVTNAALDLAKGSTIGGQTISTGPHTPPVTEGEVEGYVTNAPIDLAKGSTIGGQTLSVGPHTPPLTEGDVEGYVTNAPINLAKGSTIGGQALSVGPHTPPLTEGEIEDYVTNAALDLAKGSTLGGQAISTGPHTPPLTESEVEDFVTNAALDLAKGTTLGGQAISTGPHTPPLTEGEVEKYVTNAPLDLAAGTKLGGRPISTGRIVSASAQQTDPTGCVVRGDTRVIPGLKVTFELPEQQVTRMEVYGALTPGGPVQCNAYMGIGFTVDGQRLDTSTWAERITGDQYMWNGWWWDFRSERAVMLPAGTHTVEAWLFNRPQTDCPCLQSVPSESEAAWLFVTAFPP